MQRMINDYFEKYYNKMFKRSNELTANNFENAKAMAAWKFRMLRAWESIEVVKTMVPDSTVKPIRLGENFEAEIVLNLHEIQATEIGVEILFGQKELDEIKEIIFIEKMNPVREEKGNVVYSCTIPTTKVGVFDYSFRIYPKHTLLPHRMDFPIVKWA
jgi:hypothetical protein